MASVAETLVGKPYESHLHVSFAEGKQRAWLFANDLVQSEAQTDQGFGITVLWTDRQEAQYKAL